MKDLVAGKIYCSDDGRVRLKYIRYSSHRELGGKDFEYEIDCDRIGKIKGFITVDYDTFKYFDMFLYVYKLEYLRNMLFFYDDRYKLFRKFDKKFGTFYIIKILDINIDEKDCNSDFILDVYYCISSRLFPFIIKMFDEKRKSVIALEAGNVATNYFIRSGCPYDWNFFGFSGVFTYDGYKVSIDKYKLDRKSKIHISTIYKREKNKLRNKLFGRLHVKTYRKLRNMFSISYYLSYVILFILIFIDKVKDALKKD